MSEFREALQKGMLAVRDFKMDLQKAGLLKPDIKVFEPKANLTDPMAYGSLQFGYKEKWGILDYARCRQISYADPIVASIIQVRLNQVAAFSIPQTDKFKTGFKITMRDKEAKPSKQDLRAMKEITQFIQNTGVPENFEDTPERKRRDNFEAFLRKIVRDSLTFDQINFEITPRNDGRPYSFMAVDAATIRMVPDIKDKAEYFQGQYTGKTDPFIDVAVPQKTTFREFKPKHPRFVQLMNGVPCHQFDEWEMAFGVRNPRTDVLAAGYGFSEIEMLVATITSHMNAETYNRRFFSQGATVKGILAFEGMVPPDQLEAFRRQWYMQSSGVSNAWKTPIMAVGDKTKVNWINLHSTNKEMEFGKWLEYCIKTICGVYQIDPVEIGFDISKGSSGEKGGSSGGLGHGDQKERVLFSQEKGLRPLLRHIQYMLNEYIVYRINPNFEFEFVGLNVKTEEDELKQATEQVKTFKTVNEIRAEHDLEPIPSFEEIKSPGDMILDSSWINAWNQNMQAEKMAEQQAQMGPEGMGGEGDGEQQGDMPPGMGVPEQQDEQPAEEMPDYDNMSIEELEKELAKIEGEQQPKEFPAKKPGKQKPEVKKSLELEL